MTIKNPISLYVNHLANKRHDALIKEMQANVAKTTLVAGYTKIYA